MSQTSIQKIGPFEYDEAIEQIHLYALALTNLRLNKRFSMMPEPQSIGHGFYQILLVDKRPDQPKPAGLSTAKIRVAEQAGYKKRRPTEYHEAFGQTKTLTEWAKVAGVTRPTLKTRVDAGMTVEEAITDIAINSRRRCA